MVEPDALVVGKLRSGLRALRDVEQRHKLVQGEEFLLRAGIPAQQGEEVDDSLGEVAVLTVATAHVAGLRVVPLQGEHGESQTVAVAFRQLAFAVGFQQQRQVGELRHGVGPAESLIEQHVERCRRQPFLATDDVGNLHQVVIDDVRQMVGGQLVGTLIEHLVVEDVALHAHLATDKVVDQHLASRLNLETHDILLAIGYQLVDLLLGQGQRVAHLTAGVGVVLEVLYLATLGLQLLGRVKGDICLVIIQQLLHILLINIAALALAIRAFVATEADTLVKLDAEPLE